MGRKAADTKGMEMEAVAFTDLRSNLTDYLDQCSEKGRRYIVQRHSKGEAVLLSLAEWREIVETLDIVCDPGLLAQLVQSERDIAAGRVERAEEAFGEILGDTDAQ
jgi:prevent-host-death family protein